ncbi:MAG TPA: hypothetical protein VFY29_12195 [Terriglobia bacterium]|nr:hypothetical protein [Terriglobia bacterium]
MIRRVVSIALCALLVPAGAVASPQAGPPTVDADLQAGFRAMYALDFAASERHFSEYRKRNPDDAFGYAADAARVLFTELHRLGALDAELYVDDKHLLAETRGKPDKDVKRRIEELTAKAQKVARDALEQDPANENAMFALAFANGLEADYAFLIEKDRRAAAKPGRLGYDYAKRLIEKNAEFNDAYIWTGVTNYVVASLPFPIRWLAKLRGYPGSKDTAIKDLRRASERGSLLKPYARILLAVTFLRENRKDDARKLLESLAAEFPANPLFQKHARRLARQQPDQKN